MKGLSLNDAVKIMRGEPGSPIVLTIVREGAEQPIKIKLVRDIIKVKSVKSRLLEEGYGYVRLSSFQAKTGESMIEAIDELKKKGKLKGLVIDLRNNPGGVLNAAVTVSDAFLDDGLIVYTDGRVEDAKMKFSASSGDLLEGAPIVVLINAGSASASEIVAGALQNYGRAIVIGDSSTHGKGSVQTVLEMKDLVPQLMRTPIKTGATKITVQKYYLPSGASTQLKGVVPDIVLPSVTDHLPIGESDLPHALVWDEIPTSFFDGSPLDPQLVSSLRQRSLERQGSLDEFTFLRRNVDWFKSRQEQKLIPLNLEVRRQQREADAAFRKEMKATKEELAKQDFAYREFHLVPPPPKPALKAPEKDDADPEDEAMESLSTDDDGSYTKVDVPLRESFRVILDALQFGQRGEYLASNRLPLTARYVNKG